MAPTKVATPWQLRRVYASIFLSITTSTAALQAEPVLMAQLVGGDVARSAIMLSSTSTISGLLGLLVNQVGGRLSDKVGRKALFFAGPAFSLLQERGQSGDVAALMELNHELRAENARLSRVDGELERQAAVA